jgi:predicted ATP-dependent protease
VLKDLEIKPVQWIDQVLEVALVRMPEPREDSSADEPARATKPRTVKRRSAKKSGGLTKH